MTPDEVLPYKRYIEEALQYAAGSHTYEDVVEALADGRMQLWPGPASVVITELVENPRNRTLHYFLAGGDNGSLAQIEAMWPHIEAWGKARGATHATFVGRKGWERTFVRRVGYEPTHVLFTKDISGEPNGQE